MKVHPRLHSGVARAFRVAAPLILIALFCWGLLELFEILGGIEAIKERFGDHATLTLFFALMLPPLPSEPIAAAIATLQGFLFGTLIYWAALVLRSSIEYAGARYFLSAEAASVDFSALPVRLQKFPLHHPAFLVSGRWMPLGNHIVSVAAGLGRVHAGRFVMLTSIGVLPLAVIVPAIATGVVLAHG